ncbi:virulence factor TspB C-terminal domain-related protein, partial [Acinetobacter variabilis]|uniref:virulence factor TspB C-terminal domain-related protein n=1 Tax=Acinetobacter variabilis TaxID=70346 RepID=UPI00289DF750
GSAVKDVETAVKDGTTELKGELVNAGSAVKDVETAVKDGTTELKDELANTGEKVDSVKDEVSEVKEEVKSLKDKLTEVWEGFKEWAKNDENLDSDNEIPEIKEIDIGALDTSTFKGVPGCPAPIPVSINIGTGGETQISYEPICQLADKWSFVAPLIGFLSGALIIVGVGRKGEDGEI